MMTSSTSMFDVQVDVQIKKKEDNPEICQKNTEQPLRSCSLNGSAVPSINNNVEKQTKSTEKEEVAELTGRMEESHITTLEHREDWLHSAKHWILNRTDDATSIVSEVIHEVEYRVMGSQVSVENLPENNVHMINPHTFQTFGFGVHIDKHKYGYKIARVIENGIAMRSKLKVGDVIHSVNNKDVKNVSHALINTYFYEIDISKTFSLRLLRIERESDGPDTLVEIGLSLTVKLSDDRVTFEVEAIITTRQVGYQNTSDKRYVKQVNPQTGSPKYLRFGGHDGQTALMSTSVDNMSVFYMDVYKGDPRGKVCVIRNGTKVLNLRNGTRSLSTTNSSVQEKDNITPDHTFFYWTTVNRKNDEDVFESVTQPGYYINVLDNETLSLKKVSDNEEIPSTFRFNVVKVK